MTKIDLDKEKVHGFLLKELGMVVGKPIFNENNILSGIKNPRVLLVKKETREQKFSTLTGSPDNLFFFTKPPLFEIKDKELLSLYSESVSGIKVTNQIPKSHLVKQ